MKLPKTTVEALKKLTGEPQVNAITEAKLIKLYELGLAEESEEGQYLTDIGLLVQSYNAAREYRDAVVAEQEFAKNARQIVADQNEVLKDVTVHLLAAISLLEKIHDDVPKSKKHGLFGTKLSDYKKAAEAGRSAINWNK